MFILWPFVKKYLYIYYVIQYSINLSYSSGIPHEPNVTGYRVRKVFLPGRESYTHVCMNGKAIDIIASLIPDRLD